MPPTPSAPPSPTPELLSAALSGDASAVRALVAALTPIVQARVARVLLRRASAGRGRDVRQELEDLAQEVFVALFAQGARLLRLWAPERGLSLTNFVGLLAEREAISILRSGRRSPWTEDPTEDETFAAQPGDAAPADVQIASRQMLQQILDRLRAQLSPKGLQLFAWLLVEQHPVEEVCRLADMTPDAVYAWRSRLGKVLRSIAAEISAEESAEVSDDTTLPRRPDRLSRRVEP